MGMFGWGRGNKWESKAEGLEIQEPPSSDTKSELELEPTTKVDRRKFLQVAGAVVAVGATGELGRRIVEASTGGEARAESAPFEGDPIESFVQFEQELKDVMSEAGLQEILALPSSKQTLEQQDLLHNVFTHAFSYERLLPALQDAFEDDHIGPFYGRLLEYQAHGYIYRFAKEHKDMQSADFNKLSYNDRQHYYFLRVTDYLPEAEDIHRRDFDAREWLQFKDKKGPFFRTKEGEKDMDIPAWLTTEHENLFIEYLQDPEVRSLLADVKGMTLVEAFSSIKATIVNMEENPGASRVDMVRMALEKRKIFQQKELLGRETDTVVYVFDPEFGEPPEALLTAVDAMTGGRATFFSYKVGQDGDQSRDVLRDTYIGKSTGKTLLFFSTHGATDHLQVDYDKHGFTYDDFAEGLLERVVSAKNPQETLGDMDIMIDSCFSYEYQKNLEKALEKVYASKRIEEKIGIPFRDILLPTIVTTVHALSLADKDMGLFGEIIALPDGVSLTGDILLRKVQPKFYPQGQDLTFEMGGRGNITEIGKQQDPRKKDRSSSIA